MTANIGATDRSVRSAAAGVLAVVALFVTTGALSWVLGAIAVVLAVTASIGTCPAYLPFGVSTRKSTPTAP